MKHVFAIILAMLYCCVPVGAQGNGYADMQDDTKGDKQLLNILEAQNKEYYKTYPPIAIRYTKKHPLVVVGDWTFKPYSFINDRGEPDGFQIELLKGIFSTMHVPYDIHLMEWKKAKKELADGRAHLMIDIYKPDTSRNISYSSTSLGEYKVGIMRLKETPRMVGMELLQDSDTIYFNYKDYADMYVQNHYKDGVPFQVKYMEPGSIISAVLSGKVKYYVWSEDAMLSMLRRYRVSDRIEVETFDIPAGELRFTSTDKVLLNELDQHFIRLKHNRRYQAIRDHWFSVAPVDTDMRHFIEIFFIVTVIVIVVVVLVVITVMQRTGSQGNLKEEFLAILRMAMSLGDSQVLAISVRNLWVYNVYGNLLPEEGLSYADYENLIHPDDIIKEYEARKRVDDGNSKMPVVQFRMRKYNDKEGVWRYMSVHAFVKADRHNKPTYIYLVFIDDTERLREQKQLDRSLREFAAITEISDIGMIYYDYAGHFINCNNSILRMFHNVDKERVQAFLQKTTMQDLPILLNGVRMEKDMHMWFCAPVEIPELNIHTTFEVRIQSVYDDKKEHRGYAIALANINDNIRLRHEMNTIGDELADLKSTLARYMMELRFILERNKMNTFRWNAGTDYIEISSNLISFNVRVPLKKYCDAIIDKDSEELELLMTNPAEYFSKPIHAVRKYNTDIRGEKCQRWYSINIQPQYDENGTLTGAFGLRCDVTDFMNSQEHLKQETAKAEDSGRQKAIFLANMTHELRTPLNAINGFAQIMLTFATPEEKDEYIGIMAHNCTMLISLIDNILQLSMMDTDGISIKMEPIDFATAFPKEAEKLRHYFSNPLVVYNIDNPMTSLNVKLDMQRIAQIMDALVNNASKFTQKGFVSIGYRVDGDMLTIYCQDTGCGIPEDQHQHVFERFVKLDDFVQGTGLGLSVCKMIADSMGATIKVTSQPGEGTTVELTMKI